MTRRLLLVVNNPSFFLSHRLPVALAAQRAGWDVHVVTPDGPSVPAIRDAGLEWHAVPLSRSGLRPLEEARSIAALRRIYRRLRPGLVHHVTPKVVLYGTVSARLARVPAVVNAISGLGHAFAGKGRLDPLRLAAATGYRMALRHPRMRVIFQNEDHRAAFIERGWIRPGEGVLIPGSGVDTTAFAPAAAAREGPAVVVLAARLLWTKGVGEFAAAARLLRARGVAARFVLVGEPDPGNPGSVTPADLERWQAEGIVEYRGFQRDMASVYAQADVACLPSYTEGMPKSLIEAAACGLPIVTSDEPGCRAVVADGVNGLLVPVRDVAALAAALERLVADAPLRARLGAAGRVRAVQEFAVERIVAAHLAVYDQLGGAGRG